MFRVSIFCFQFTTLISYRKIFSFVVPLYDSDDVFILVTEFVLFVLFIFSV